MILLHAFRWLFYSHWRKSFSFIYPNKKWHDKYSCFLATYVYWLFKPIAFLLAKAVAILSISSFSDSFL